jgi:hypothetical protein
MESQLVFTTATKSVIFSYECIQYDDLATKVVAELLLK